MHGPAGRVRTGFTDRAHFVIRAAAGGVAPAGIWAAGGGHGGTVRNGLKRGDIALQNTV